MAKAIAMALQAQGQSGSDVARQLDREASLSREQAQREAGGVAGSVIASGGAATPILADPSAWQTWLMFGCVSLFLSRALPCFSFAALKLACRGRA